MNNAAALKRQIHALDFAIVEMNLFLDTHPHDQNALALMHRYRRERCEAVAKYEAQFGPYEVTADRVGNTEHWSWIDNPWPWEYGVEC